VHVDACTSLSCWNSVFWQENLPSAWRYMFVLAMAQCGCFRLRPQQWIYSMGCCDQQAIFRVHTEKLNRFLLAVRAVKSNSYKGAQPLL
jgi:hypothetical protein